MEQFHFWLSGLREISQAEQRVLSGHVSGHVCTVQLLSQAIVHCQKASAALKVSNLVIVTCLPHDYRSQIYTHSCAVHVQYFLARQLLELVPLFVGSDNPVSTPEFPDPVCTATDHHVPGARSARARMRQLQNQPTACHSNVPRHDNRRGNTQVRPRG